MNKKLREKLASKTAIPSAVPPKPSLLKKAGGVVYDAGYALVKYTRKLFWFASTGILFCIDSY